MTSSAEPACRTCLHWKRRTPHQGTCYGKESEHYGQLSRQDDRCGEHAIKVIKVSG